jgi:hypothetical protein
MQAGVARRRHNEQTKADRRRRITESFSKAIEQLGSDKLEVRLGGIYALEWISKESQDDYWTVMENLTAFVRERTRRTEAERTVQPFEQRVAQGAYFLWLEAGKPEGQADEFWVQAAEQERYGNSPAADIAAVLSVIKRRTVLRTRLQRTGFRFMRHIDPYQWLRQWRLDFTAAVLRRADFRGAQLEYAILQDAHLEDANFQFAHLKGALLQGAHLEDADFRFAYLDGADLSDATGLATELLAFAYGDAETVLPYGVSRPPGWPALATSPGSPPRGC